MWDEFPVPFHQYFHFVHGVFAGKVLGIYFHLPRGTGSVRSEETNMSGSVLLKSIRDHMED